MASGRRGKMRARTRKACIFSALRHAECELTINDARIQGPEPTKTIVHHAETARNLAEFRSRILRETQARCVWITPVPVDPDRVSRHWALSRFGVRFRPDDITRVAAAMRDMRALGDPVVDLHALFDAGTVHELLMDDGVHFTLAGQRRLAFEIVRAWSELQ